MMDERPQFERMISDIERARSLWEQLNRDASRRLLKVAGSIALASSEPRGENAPIPEGVRKIEKLLTGGA